VGPRWSCPTAVSVRRRSESWWMWAATDARSCVFAGSGQFRIERVRLPEGVEHCLRKCTRQLGCSTSGDGRQMARRLHICAPDDLAALGVASGDRIRNLGDGSRPGRVERGTRIPERSGVNGSPLERLARMKRRQGGFEHKSKVNHAEPFVGIPRMSASGVRLEAVDNAGR
jgi:hypothetical protein